MIPALWLAGFLAAALVWQWRRRPVIFKLALRSATRRPGESALVIAGSLLGAAIITGSFIVGDTLQSSIQATAFTQLGEVDEVVTVSSEHSAGVMTELTGLEDPSLDGAMVVRSLPAAASAETDGGVVGEPGAQVLEMDFGQARAFGRDEEATGIEGDTPAFGEAAITETLAETLQIEEGASITVYIYGPPMVLTVEQILPERGLAGLWLTGESSSPNVFVAPGTIEDVYAEFLDAGVPEGKARPADDLFLFSNEGDVISGAGRTDEAVAAIEDALEGASLRVEPIKADRLRIAEEGGSAFEQVFLGIGAFAVIAGLLLLVNVFVMLAEERRSQLGMLRAMGMKRSDMIRGFLIEGAGYALIANIVGAILGIVVGWAIVAIAAPIFSGNSDVLSLRLVLDAQPSSVARGFMLGTIFCLIVTAGTSIRISRLNVIRAIRELPEPPRQRVRRRSIFIGVLSALLGAAWFVSSVGDARAWAGSILGLPIVLFGLLPGLSQLVSRRVAVIGAATGTLLWGIFGDRILDGGFFDYGEIFAFVMQGVLLTFSAVLLISFNQEYIAKMFAPLRAHSLSLRLGLAYPLARRFRTALSIGMFALVIFTMVLLTVLSSIFEGQVDEFTERAAGGFDLVATSSSAAPPKRTDIKAVDGVTDVSVLRYGIPLFDTKDNLIPEPWPASGIDEAFVDIGPPALDERLPGLDADAVWETLLEDPRTVVISAIFLEGGSGGPAILEPGDTIAVVDPTTGEGVPRRIIGIFGEDPSFSGPLMSRDSIEQALGDRATPSRFYIDAEGNDAAAEELAIRLQGLFLPRGVEADTFRAIVEEAARIPLQILRLMQGYLALGLIVGIAGLGVVMIRAVRDRRREIGVLRSLGALSSQVGRAFLIESGFVAAEGIITGSALAIVTAQQLISTGGFGESVSFDVPWGQVGLLCGGTLLAALLATAWPAARAASTAPAVALRIAD